MNKMPIVFISYNSVSSEIARDIAEQLFQLAVVQRYETDVRPSQSIEEYMKSIRDADFVVSIISPEYLKSPGCMYEGIMAIKNVQTIFFVVEDAVAKQVYNPKVEIETVRYWISETESFQQEISTLPESARKGFEKKLERLKFISDNVADLLEKINDTKGTTSYKTVMEIKDVIKHTRFDSKDADIRNAILSILYDNIPEQERIYYFINKEGSLSRADLEPLIKKNKNATLRVLNDMITSGILIKTGGGSQVKYTVSHNLDASA